MGSACNLIWYCMSYKMAAYSLDSDCIISHFSVRGRPAADCSCGVLVCGKSGAKFRPAADRSCGILVCGKSGANSCRRSAADLPQTVPVAYQYAASLEQSFILPQICCRLFLWHTSMRQVCSKISSCRRSAADCSCGILVCGKSAAKFLSAAYFGILFAAD